MIDYIFLFSLKIQGILNHFNYRIIKIIGDGIVISKVISRVRFLII